MTKRDTTDLQRRAAALQKWNEHEATCLIAEGKGKCNAVECLRDSNELINDLLAALSARETPEPSALEQRLRKATSNVHGKQCWCNHYTTGDPQNRSGGDGKPICVKCEFSYTAHLLRQAADTIATLTQAKAHLEDDLALERARTEETERQAQKYWEAKAAAEARCVELEKKYGTSS